MEKLIYLSLAIPVCLVKIEQTIETFTKKTFHTAIKMKEGGGS